MSEHEIYMQRCLQLAKIGLGAVAPNPMVGSVIVCNQKIIGEGYHQLYGQAHAEVNSINSVENKELLKQATLYVNLEPCSHFGKTPPCADLIIKYKIPRVVIGTVDHNSVVNGKGIEKLIKSGADVVVGVLEEECRELNKRFFTFHQKKRPYIILKWAQTADGFIDNKRIDNAQPPLQISCTESKKIVHQWRSQEQAIMVGTNTALLDNPELTVREHLGNNPLRVCIDRNGRIPENYNLFDQSVPTLIFTSVNRKSKNNLEFIQINFERNVISQILKELYSRNIQSLIVEGGEQLLTSFINKKKWDEARVFISSTTIKDGVKAPTIEKAPITSENYFGDKLLSFIK
jgi:diaminohydroxyphosphoribosylaminopyrimidine deaminase/5-amino-6-(5-phosphoribosylamino)uracil reductase